MWTLDVLLRCITTILVVHECFEWGFFVSAGWRSPGGGWRHVLVCTLAVLSDDSMGRRPLNVSGSAVMDSPAFGRFPPVNSLSCCAVTVVTPGWPVLPLQSVCYRIGKWSRTRHGVTCCSYIFSWCRWSRSLAFIIDYWSAVWDRAAQGAARRDHTSQTGTGGRVNAVKPV